MEDKRLDKYYGFSSNKEKILARIVKINEKVSELCDEVLMHNK